MDKHYKVEVFFRDKDILDKDGIDVIPDLATYHGHTTLLEFTTWESPRNEVLRLHPDAAFILIHESDFIDIPEAEKELKDYETSFLKVGPSRIHSLGVIAKKEIPAETVLHYLTGEIVNVADVEGDYPKGEWNALSDEVFLCRKRRTIYGFINHSRTPNSYIDFATLEVKTKEEIPAGREITIDYKEEALPKSYLDNFGKYYL